MTALACIIAAVIVGNAVGFFIPVNHTSPPDLLEQGEQQVFFEDGKALEVPCYARGNPPPRYIWSKGVEVFDPDSANVTVVAGRGTLMFPHPDSSTEGLYQCRIANEKGVAWSHFVKLVRAYIITSHDRSGDFNEDDDQHEDFSGDSDTLENIVQVGSSLVMDCSVPPSVPPPKVTWMIGGWGSQPRPVELGPRVVVDDTGRLIFTNILPLDAVDGNLYFCAVENPFLKKSVYGEGQAIKPRGDISVANVTEPSVLWRPASRIVVLQNETVRVKCVFKGNPTPTITWARLRGDRPLPDTASTAMGSTELVIDRVQFEDDGTYSCTATNSEATASESFSIVVEAKPEWIEKPENQQVLENDNVTFLCKASGYPPSSVEWAINGIPLMDLPVHPRRIVTLTSLTFLNVVPADTAVVQCNVSNTHGYLYKNAILNVLRIPPTFTRRLPMNITVIEGSPVNITCSVYGAPKPNVTWIFKGKTVPLDSDDPLVGSAYHTRERNELVIRHVSVEDSGEYRCSSVNQYGDISASGHLTVLARTRVIDGPPRYPLVAAVGSNIELKCKVSTDQHLQSSLTHRWYKNGRPIPAGNTSHYTHYSNGSLFISPTAIHDTGMFLCNASTSRDFTVARAGVLIQGPPDPPAWVNVRLTGQRSVVVTWAASDDNNADISRYTVTQRSVSMATNSSSSSVSTIRYTFNGTTLGTTLEVLPWRRYNFSVMAWNSMGHSDISEDNDNSSVTVPPDVPERHPTGVTIEDRQENVLYVSWEPLHNSEANGPGFYYLVRYWRTDVETPFIRQRKLTDFGVQRNHLFVNVDGIHPYKAQVIAGNDLGVAKGSVRNVIGYSGSGVPTISPVGFKVHMATRLPEDDDSNNPPDEENRHQRVLLSWHAVDTGPQVIKGTFKGYLIRYWQEGEPESRAKVIHIPASVNGTVRTGLVSTRGGLRVTSLPAKPHDVQSSEAGGTSYGQDIWLSVDGFPPYTRIHSQVAVMNTKYTGPASPTLTFDTPEAAPGAVQNLTVHRLGPVITELSFLPPAKKNGILRNFSVEIVTRQQS